MIKQGFLRKKYGPDKVYSVWCLWLAGVSISLISARVALRKGQVRTIVENSDYADRESMSDRARQNYLDELQMIRIENGIKLDDGRLDGFSFKIVSLTRRQKRERPRP